MVTPDPADYDTPADPLDKIEGDSADTTTADLEDGAVYTSDFDDAAFFLRAAGVDPEVFNA